MKDLIIQMAIIYALYSIYANGLMVIFFIVFTAYIYYIIRFLQLKTLFKKTECYNAKKMLEERKTFICTLIHDLKVPTLAQLRGVELLQNEILGNLNEEQKNLTEQILNSCKCVLNMINMSVNTYDIENESFKLTYENFNLSDIIISCFEEISNEVKAKQISLSYSPVGDDINLEADKTEIKKVIINLLLNAINYSNIGGRIAIKTFSDKNRVIMSISGMEREVDTQYTTIGYGIGMNLSKKIIEYHNGKIFIPEGGNLSNTYTFILPKNSDAKYCKACTA